MFSGVPENQGQKKWGQGTNQNFMVPTNLVHIANGPAGDTRDSKMYKNQHPNKLRTQKTHFSKTRMKPFAISTHPDNPDSMLYRSINEMQRSDSSIVGSDGVASGHYHSRIRSDGYLNLFYIFLDFGSSNKKNA